MDTGDVSDNHYELVSTKFFIVGLKSLMGMCKELCQPHTDEGYSMLAIAKGLSSDPLTVYLD
jgi:hypothetical protein